MVHFTRTDASPDVGGGVPTPTPHGRGKGEGGGLEKIRGVEGGSPHLREGYLPPPSRDQPDTCSTVGNFGGRRRGADQSEGGYPPWGGGRGYPLPPPPRKFPEGVLGVEGEDISGTPV